MTLRLLITTLALAALPASAHAATVELRADGTLLFSARPGEANSVRVHQNGPSGVDVFDGHGSPRPVGPGCAKSGDGVSCPGGVTRVELDLGDEEDVYRGRRR